MSLVMNRFLSTLFTLILVGVVVGCADKAQTEAMDGDHDAMAEVSDKDMVVEALVANAESFRSMIDGLSPEQLAFQESPERWSIAGVAEHIVTVENMFQPMIVEVLASEPTDAMPSDSAATDEMIMAVMQDRTQKFQAPDAAQPTGKFKTNEDILSAFNAAREQTMEMITATDVDLRSVSGENPALGMLDGAQWLLFIATHADRHVAQMAQVKADDNFPEAAM